LFLMLDAAAWGRAALGLDILRELRSEGDDVAVVASCGTMPLFRGCPFDVVELGDHLGPLSQLVVDDAIETCAPDAILLCDFHSCNRYFELLGIDPRFVLRHRRPVIGMDIWNCHETDSEMDHLGDVSVRRADWVEELTGRLVPAPIGRLSAAAAYCSLPYPAPIPRSVRRHVRANLSLRDEDRAVLFCTAGWQHDIKNPDGRRLLTALPELLWSHLAKLDPSVRLVHVGPQSIGIDDSRYVWLPSLSPENFDRLLGSVDLFLSANISATTVSRAVTAGLPVLVVQNSLTAHKADEAEASHGRSLSPTVRAWLERTLPIYPFRLWPLGYWRFLEPVFRDNPYYAALDVVELIDEPGFLAAGRRLLFDRNGRDAAIRCQANYVATARKLPTATRLIETYLQ
jgi:hypothetical protein